MARVCIIAGNLALLILLMIGLPAAARGQLGDWQISSAATGRKVMYLGLGLAITANVLGAAFGTRVRPLKALCWEWACIFGALLIAYLAFVHGKLDFRWLRHALQWLHKWF